MEELFHYLFLLSWGFLIGNKVGNEYAFSTFINNFRSVTKYYAQTLKDHKQLG